MSDTMRVRVGQKGRIVLPAAARAALEIEEDDELIAIVEDRQIILMTRDEALRQLRGMCSGMGTVDEFLAERRETAARENAEVDAWLATHPKRPNDSA